MPRHIILLPFADKRHKVVSFELPVHDLTEEVEVGDEGRLQDDWDIRGVEEFHGEGSLEPSHFLALQLQVHMESLQTNFSFISLSLPMSEQNKSQVCIKPHIYLSRKLAQM